MHTAHTVHFLGVGAIGLPIAARLSTRARVVAIDPSPTRRAEAAALGLDTVAALDSSGSPDFVVIMVANAAQLQNLIADDLFARLSPGAICVVMSTVGPEAVQTAAAAAHEAGITMIDAPVTGGVARAIAGELVLFIAGDPDAVEECEPLLSVLGTLHRCGQRVGDGQSYKMVNQLLCSVHLVAAAESLALAERLGLDSADVLKAVRHGAGASFMLEDRGGRMQSGRPEPQTALRIFTKDSQLVLETARQAGLSTPLAEASHSAFKRAEDLGFADADDSMVLRAYVSAQATTHQGPCDSADPRHPGVEE